MISAQLTCIIEQKTVYNAFSIEEVQCIIKNYILHE